jgi:predicted amidohydrolase
MPDSLTLSVAQPLTISYDVEANALAHAELVRTANARVVVFPEMSLTGYNLDVPALSADDPHLAPIIAACAAAGSLALVGAPLRGEDGKEHIGMLAVDGTGARTAYHKMWPGGAEPERFAPGAAPGVVEVDGWRLGLAICRDTGIHQHAADTAALGIDLYVAGVLEHAEDAHITDERALRIATTHHIWAAIASFAGPTGGGYEHAAGCSAIWSPKGELIARAGTEPGALARATIVSG